MNENRFDILTSKYLASELDTAEFTELERMVSANEYYQLKFKEYVKVNTILQLSEEKDETVNTNVAFNEFINTVERPKKFKLVNLLKYVAVFAGVVFSVYSINSLTNLFGSTDPRMALVIPNEDIMIYEEDGTPKKLELTNQASNKITEGIQEFNVGEDVSYGISQFKAPIKSTTYTLKIPFGKKLSVTLGDGTKVYLNSGSSLTYPNTFKDSKNRVVTLQGEGYFEVTKNKKKPFIVKTDLLNVRVLGTEFNVSAYKGDGVNSVTLVEGKVAISESNSASYSASKSLLLNPNEKVTVAKGKKTTKNIVNNIAKYTSWKNKELFFKNDKFIDISKKLERNFNVKIISENKNLNNKEFTGRFNKQDVFEILDAFRVHTSFVYIVKGNSIIIKNK